MFIMTPSRILSALLFSLTIIQSGCRRAPETPPNVVLILADDMGYGDSVCYNPNSKVPTPHIDHIASQGVRLTDIHSPSAVCTPSRYALLTGRYAWRSRLKSGVLWGWSPLLIERDRLTLPEMLRREGYTTAGFGKWHLGLGDQDSTDYFAALSPGPNEVGFDYFYGIPASLDMEPYLYFENDRAVAPPTEMVEAGAPTYADGGPFWRAGPIAPGFRHVDVLPETTERAVAFIEEQASLDDAAPFFLYVPFSAPHTPWLPTEGFRGASEAGEYGDFTTMVDDAVGKIDAALARVGFAENTIVIFTSDNGSYWPEDWIPEWDHESNGRWRGMKADIWEGGHRVPFVVRWPGRLAPDETSRTTASLVDVMATIASAVGAELPSNAAEDSYDLMPILRGEVSPNNGKEAVVMHSSRGMFAIRKGPWKLIEGLGSGGFTDPVSVEPAEEGPAGQLYHLEDDPEETTNLWLEHADVVKELQQLLDRYREQGYSRPGAIQSSSKPAAE